MNRTNSPVLSGHLELPRRTFLLASRLQVSTGITGFESWKPAAFEALRRDPTAGYDEEQTFFPITVVHPVPAEDLL